MIDEAVTYLDQVATLIGHDDHYDIVLGVAGAIPVLLELNRSRPSSDALDLAIRCGWHLTESAERAERGLGWVNANSDGRPLTGFAHGCAGIALSPFQLHAATQVEDFLETAAEAIVYERALFDKAEGNWPDLRPLLASNGATDVPVNYNWCSGSSGIGMARSRTLRYWDDGAIAAEIEAAVLATLGGGFGDNMSLCHGDLGNLELLHEAHAALDRPDFAKIRRRIAEFVVKRLDQEGHSSGLPGRIQSHGLMRGAAGVAFGLLRLALPNQIPSVLLIDPPPEAAATGIRNDCLLRPARSQRRFFTDALTI